jgi:cytidylate kinase
VATAGPSSRSLGRRTPRRRRRPALAATVSTCGAGRRRIAGTVSAVCISHSSGAEGEAVGRAVAERLGFRYVDDEVIEEAAEWAEISPALVADAERRKPAIARMFGRLAEQATPPRLPTGEAARSLPTDADLRLVIVRALQSIAEGGSVVIASHAASFALAGQDVLRVLVTGSAETRAQRLATSRGLDTRAARQLVKQEDAGRADYLRRFYAIDRELPTHFDLVVNTDSVTVERAANLVASAAG